MEKHMETTYKIRLVTNAKDKDLLDALNIYIHTVDENSETSTSEIRDYIQQKYKDNRKMFFYILYVNNNVVGFAEYGYLPQSEVLLIDYICTSPRNHTYFYNFYHMLYEEICTSLKKENLYIKYIITELSLKKDKENRYIDIDSNYFRQLLSMEGFKVLKTPYFQPYCNLKHELSFMDFNIAIKPLINGLPSKTHINEEFYFELLSDIYINHYVAWYEKYIDSEQVKIFFDNLLNKAKKEFLNKVEIDDITLVNCLLFQNGLCNQVSSENITLHARRKYQFKQWVVRILCVFFAIITAFFCYSNYFNTEITFACSLLTILSAIVALFQFVKDQLL